MLCLEIQGCPVQRPWSVLLASEGTSVVGALAGRQEPAWACCVSPPSPRSSVVCLPDPALPLELDTQLTEPIVMTPVMRGHAARDPGPGVRSLPRFIAGIRRMAPRKPPSLSPFCWPHTFSFSFQKSWVRKHDRRPLTVARRCQNPGASTGTDLALVGRALP